MLWGLKGQNNLTDCPSSQPTCSSYGHKGRPRHLQPGTSGQQEETVPQDYRALDQGSHPSSTTDLGPVMLPPWACSPTSNKVISRL